MPAINAPSLLAITVSLTIPYNHPAEPVLVVFDDGRFEFAPLGDADHIAENDPAFVNYFTIPSMLTDLNTYCETKIAEARLSALAEDVLS